MAIINDGVTIGSGLEASVMRHKMESKDTLATKGALYVGTGTKKDSFTVTKSIAPNKESDNGKVLVADSTKDEGWRIDTCPIATEATTVSTKIGKAKITDIFEDDGTTVKTATLAKGLQSNSAQSTGAGNTWYDFNGTSNSLGSLTFPTIIRTSEPRPKAEVKSGETTVTKEVALVEDIPTIGTWKWSGSPELGDQTNLTEEGIYELKCQEPASMGEGWVFFVEYVRGQHTFYGPSFVFLNTSSGGGFSVMTPSCSGDGNLKLTQTSSSYPTQSETLQFWYRKIH